MYESQNIAEKISTSQMYSQNRKWNLFEKLTLEKETQSIMKPTGSIIIE